MYSASGSPPNPIVPRGWPATSSNTAAFHHHRPVWCGTVVCSRRPLFSSDDEWSPRIPWPPPRDSHPVVALPALRVHLWPTRSSVLSSLLLFAPFHHNIPSPLTSLDLVIEQPRSGGFRSLPLSPASTFVLFLVYFSHPRTVEMQFASELLLLPPSQPVAASNNRRSADSPPRGIICQKKENFRKFDRDCKRQYELSYYSQWRKRKTDNIRCIYDIPLISGRCCEISR